MAFAHYGKHADRAPADATISSHDIVYFVSTDVHVRYEGSANPDRRCEVKFYMTVSSIEQADATGKNWEIEGQLMRATPRPHYLELDSEQARNVLVQYGTANKKGTLYVLAE
jgi:hypothetical protein